MQTDEIERLFDEGCRHHDAGLFEAALVCFDRVVTGSPGFAPGHLNRGVALQGLGRWQESVMSLSQALALDSGSAAAWNCLGVAMNHLRHFSEAVECLTKAVALEPGYAMAHNNLGAALRDLRRLDEAISSCPSSSPASTACLMVCSATTNSSALPTSMLGLPFASSSVQAP